MDHVAEAPNMLVDGSAHDVPGADASPPADNIDALLKVMSDRRMEHGTISLVAKDAKEKTQSSRVRAASAFRETTLILARAVRQLPEVDMEELVARAQKAGSLSRRLQGDRYTALARLACGPSEPGPNVARIASVIRAMAERGLVADEVFGADKTFWAVHQELCAPAGKVLSLPLSDQQDETLHAGAVAILRLVRHPRTGRFIVADVIADSDGAVCEPQAEESRAASAKSAKGAPDTPHAAHRPIGTDTEERVPPEAKSARSDAGLSEVADCSPVAPVEVEGEGEPVDAPARRCAVQFETNVRKADRAAFRRLRQYGAFHENGIWIGSPFEGLNDMVSRFGGTFADSIETRNKRQGMDAADAGQSRLSGRASRSGMLQSARGGAAGITHRSVVWSSDVDLQGVLSRVSSGPSSPRAVRR